MTQQTILVTKKEKLSKIQEHGNYVVNIEYRVIRSAYLGLKLNAFKFGIYVHIIGNKVQRI